MKNIIFLLAFVVVAMTANAQDKKVKWSFEQSYTDFALGASDTVSNYDTAWSARIIVSKDYDFDYNSLVSLTHVSGTPDMVVQLYGRIFSEDDYDTLETFYHQTAVDTVIRWAETTNKRYRELLFKLEENGTAKTLVEDLKHKVWR